jgi:hypothetical protein
MKPSATSKEVGDWLYFTGFLYSNGKLNSYCVAPLLRCVAFSFHSLDLIWFDYVFTK